MYGLQNVQSLTGLALVMGLCWLVSEDRRRFPWKLAIGAVGVQLGLVLLLFGVPQARAALQGVGQAVDGLSASTAAGTAFVFGYLGGGAQPYPTSNPAALFVLAFRVLPVILVVCALSALLWHLKILKWITRAFGFVFEKTLGLRGPPALAVAATIFMGQVEGPIFIRAYLDKLSRSELFMLMSVGMSCVSGSTMVAYVTLLKDSLPNAAAHVLTASLISAPAGVLLARIIVPAGAVEAEGETPFGDDKRYDSAIDAVSHGIGDGLQVVLNVGATLIVFVAFAAILDRLLSLAAAGGGPAPDHRVDPGRGVRAPGLGDRGALERGGRGGAALGGQDGADGVLRLHSARPHTRRRPLAAHPHDHDLCALRFRQHRVGGHQRLGLQRAGAGAGGPKCWR